MDQASLVQAGPDYCSYVLGTSRRSFRGPEPDLDKPYLAFLGGSETFGRYVERPYPALLQDALGMTCANFGAINAGVDVFLRDPAVLVACRRAVLTVVAVTGAVNLSNRHYSVHPRRNDRFVQAAPPLKQLYPEADFSDIHFTGHLVRSLRLHDPVRFLAVVEEMQTAWVARMRRLLEEIDGRVILLWTAPVPPPARGLPCGLPPSPGVPAFVEGWMLSRLDDLLEGRVDCVYGPGAIGARAGMCIPEGEGRAAALTPGAAAHVAALEVLAGPLRAALAGGRGRLPDRLRAR